VYKMMTLSASGKTGQVYRNTPRCTENKTHLAHLKRDTSAGRLEAPTVYKS
jgi:hypothetical protein